MMERILIVDDDKEIVQFVTALLRTGDYEVSGFTDPQQSIAAFAEFSPALCVLDFRMPGISGGELFKHFRTMDPAVEAVFLTGEADLEVAVNMMKLGACDFLSKPVRPIQLVAAVTRGLEHRFLVLQNQHYRDCLERLVEIRTGELKTALAQLATAHTATLNALGLALDFRDQSTSGHSRRVADLTTAIAREIGISGGALTQIEQGALLHDIGKLKIPDEILLKPGCLSDKEWKIMRCHPEYGRQFLEHIDFLGGAAEIVYAHHEKFDGGGYPRRLRGEEIPIGARCFAIVDAIDALVYDRPYHKAISLDMALDEIRRCSGTHFDPAIVDVALDHIAYHISKRTSAIA
jgi:putative nucleotidyltransferase with HDIG domain